MAKTIVTALLFTAVGIGLSACFEEPRDGSHGPGYKAAGSDARPQQQDYQRPYQPAYPSTY
jgi:hypothetical protein